MNWTKVVAYAVIVVAIIGALKYAHGAVYQSGWNAAVVEQEALIREAQQQAVKRARTEWEMTAATAEAEIVVEEKIVEVIRTVEKEIPKVVERIVEVRPECSDLGADFAGLLNEQVNSGASGTNSGSNAAAEPDS